MTILVTGAMGHVGLQLVRRLASRETVLAQYNRTFQPDEAEACGANATWVAADLTDTQAVSRLCGDHGVESCIHLAAIANEAFARPDPVTAVRVNVGATANLLDAARLNGWRRFINCSTGSVFKHVDPGRSIMEDQPPDADSIYGSTKACGEALTTAFRAQYGVSAASVRLSRIYGPPIEAGSVGRGAIPAILIGALKGEPRRDASGGDFHAGFTYIDDVVSGLIAALDTARLNHPVYHLAPARNSSISEIVEVVRALVPDAIVEVGPGIEPWAQSTPMRGPMDGTRFAADTGFTPRYSLEEGIGEYCRWLRDQLATEAAPSR